MGNAYRKALFIVTREEKFRKITEKSIGGVGEGDSCLTASNPPWAQIQYNQETTY